MFYSSDYNEARKSYFFLEHALNPPSGFIVELGRRLVCSDHPEGYAAKGVRF
jgi:hypothetical protein